MNSYQLKELEGLDRRNNVEQSFSKNSIGGNAQVHFGNQYIYGGAETLEHGFRFVQPVGLCLFQAPAIDSKLFIGREAEINQIHEMLEPDKSSTEQRRLVLGGIGGIGKTQLAIAYTKQYQDVYNSVFWLNARDETTLKASYRSIAELIFDIQDYQAIGTEQILIQVKRWLSDTKNSKWLLIFDNYDEPQSYNIESYFPYATHGCILITTRLPDQVNSQNLLIRPLHQTTHSLQILETRSQRSDIADDPYAIHLAERLDGLPLALATAGAYLYKSTWSFQRYLDEYEKKWKIPLRRPLQLHEYQDRTLYTTWDLSYWRLEQEDAEVAQLLKTLAYFDHQAIWYELFHAGVQDDLPEWLKTIAGDSSDFESAMRILVDYCFLEVHTATQSYSIHACVHDWTLAGLNATVDLWRYWYVFDCVANSIDEEESEHLGYFQYARFAAHAQRLTHDSFREVGQEIVESRFPGGSRIGSLLLEQNQFTSATVMELRLLAGVKKALGPDHPSTLTTFNSLGVLYTVQGKLIEAEGMLEQALAGREHTLGPDDTSTLDTLHNLGLLYMEQGKLTEAEKVYNRALTGYKKALGPDDKSTLHLVNNLGCLYMNQGRLAEAEGMLEQALAGRENTLGPDNMSTLNTVHDLGTLYAEQSKLDQAAKMLNRALTGRENTLGSHSLWTLKTVGNLGAVYMHQGKLLEAEKMHDRVLAGYEKVLGPDHKVTLIAVNNLGLLYTKQFRLDQAEVTFKRALAGLEKALGPDDVSTLLPASNLGLVYLVKGDLDEAEKTYLRALAGHEKALGPDHHSTLRAVQNLGSVYMAQGKLTEAEEMYNQALTGYHKTLKPDHTSILQTFNNLGELYHAQGRLDQAEEMLDQALAGYDKVLGPNHTTTLGTVKYLGRLHRDQSKLDQAEKMYQRLLAGCEKVPEFDDSIKLDVLIEWGSLSYLQGKVEDTKRLFSQGLTGYFKILDSSDAPSEDAIQAYAGVLSKSIRTGYWDPSGTQIHFSNLVHHFERHGTRDIVVTHWLARALLKFEDDENARLTFAYCVSSEVLDMGVACCDGCRRQLNAHLGLHICRQCLDVDLCDSCMSAYATSALTVSNCSDHQFCSFSNAVSQASKASTTRGELERDAWMQGLKKKYQLIADDR